MHVAILYNEPVLSPDDPDYAAEAGVLEAIDEVAAGLEAGGHAVLKIGAGPAVEVLLGRLQTTRPDVVFNLCEGYGGSAGEAYVVGLLELLDLPYTGCPAECLSLVRDKARTK